VVVIGVCLGLARAYTALGFKTASEGRLEEAIQHLKYSLTLCDEAKQDNYVQQAVQDYSELIGSAQHYRAAIESLHLLVNDPSLEQQQRSELIIAQLRMSKEKYRDSLHPSQKQLEVSKLTPQFVSEGCIFVEIGSDLVDERILNEQVIKFDIPAMRKRIRESMGVSIPSIRLSDNSSLLPENGYQVLLYNTNYARDVVSSRGPLASRYDAVIVGLEIVLRAHLDILIGVQEVQGMLDEWQQEGGEERRVLIKHALPDGFSVACLTYVLRGLVKEQVPITDLESILTTFERAQTHDIGELIEHVRHTLKAALPGNQAG
jgi:flagellar biosynthesis component FlhA